MFLPDPVPGVQVHASSLLVYDQSDFLVAWFAGSHEGAANSTIRIYSSRDSRIQSITPRDQVPHWNPVLAHGPDGATWLFFKRGGRIDTWTTWVTTSLDDGRTWTEPRELAPGDTTGGRGPVRQAPVCFRGLWMAPGSVEEWDPPRWDSFVDISADKGETWQQVMLPLDHTKTAGAGCIQPCLVPQPNGTLIAFTRSTAGAVFRSATSEPYRWPPLEPTSLPNNNSGIAAAALPDGRIVLVHNDVAVDWGARSRLIWSTSCDAGRSWTTAGIIEDSHPGQPDGRPEAASATGVVTSGEGEYSYPSLQVVNGELWVTYTWQRRTICLKRLPVGS